MLSISRKCFPEENFQCTTLLFWFSFSFQPLRLCFSNTESNHMHQVSIICGPPTWMRCFSGSESFFQMTFPFSSVFQTLLMFKFQALFLGALALTQILSLHLSLNLRHCCNPPTWNVIREKTFCSSLLPLAASLQPHSSSRFWLPPNFIPNRNPRP